MGFNPLKAVGSAVKSVTKPLKKVLKSPQGIALLMALGVPAYAKYGAAAGWPGTTSGMLGPGSKMAGLGNWLYGTAGGIEGASGNLPGILRGTGGGKYVPGTPGLWGRSGVLGKSAIVGGATGALTGAGIAEEEDLPEEFTSNEGQEGYLQNRALFEDEWADWLLSMGKAETKAEALEMVRDNPMFSEGGRVKAQGGLFAGQMAGRHPGMNQMNPMGMNQGLGAPNLGSRSMGMTPGMGQQPMDPRMAQMMQAQKLQGGPRRTIPKESEDTELIQLIKMLTSLGIPMEQLRGRTKEELVEMLVSVKGKTGGEQQGRPEVEEEVVEEEIVEAADGGLMRRKYFSGAYGQGAGDRGGNPHASAAENRAAGRAEGPAWSPGTGGTQHIPTPKVTPKDDGIISKFKNWQGNYNTNARQNWMKKNVDKLVAAGLMKVSGAGVYPNPSDVEEGAFSIGKVSSPNYGYTYTGPGELNSPEALRALQGIGYTGGMTTPGTGGGGGSQSYTTAGGAGTTEPTDDEDYYKFAEWDQWLMPGETTPQALMPGGYKKEILGNKGGLMRTGYAMGTEHPIISSKDGKQLDMRDSGGYQPHGKAEKHDDVRALLAQGEFVMTSDAVKGMGGGDREVGAKKMYNLMHNMEAMA